MLDIGKMRKVSDVEDEEFLADIPVFGYNNTEAYNKNFQPALIV